MAREEASPVPRIHGVYPEWVKGQGQGPGAWVHRGLGLTGAKRESHGSETQAVRAGAPNARARAHAAHAKRPVDRGGESKIRVDAAGGGAREQGEGHSGRCGSRGRADRAQAAHAAADERRSWSNKPCWALAHFETSRAVLGVRFT